MGSPIIQSLRNDLAALHKAGVIGQETLRAFDAPLAPSEFADCRIANTTIPAQQSPQS